MSLAPAPTPDPLAGSSQYFKVKDLGTGSFGSVGLYGRHEGGSEPTLVACKFMPRSGVGVDIQLIHREVQSHRVLRHPHVIRFKQLGLTPSHIYMTMEYADQGDLLGFLRRKGPLPEADARWLFQQLVFGLDYCHLKGVVNRDLKPENLLLKLTPEASKRHRRHQMAEREQQLKLREQLRQAHAQQYGASLEGVPDGGGAQGIPPLNLPPLPPLGLIDHRTSNTFNLHLKIADFGLSKKPANSLPKTRVGTISYMAPEVLLAGPTQRYDGHKADIWSAGVVLYAMLFSRVPFEVHEGQDGQGNGGGVRDRAATIQRILAGDWGVPHGINVSPQVLHLLGQILVPDPNKRASMEKIMEHPWFRAGLPPAALTMNVQLVRQQAAQGLGGVGEQPEEEIDAVLEVLRRQTEEESGLTALMSGNYSRSSTVTDSEAEERRNFEVKGLMDDEEDAGQGGRGTGTGMGTGREGAHAPRVPAGGQGPTMAQWTMAQQQQEAAQGSGGGAQGSPGRMGGQTADRDYGKGASYPGPSPMHPQHQLVQGAALQQRQGQSPQRQAQGQQQQVRTGGGGGAGTTCVPNAFLARLACMGVEDVSPGTSSSGGGEAAAMAAAAAAAVSGGGGGGARAATGGREALGSPRVGGLPAGQQQYHQP